MNAFDTMKEWKSKGFPYYPEDRKWRDDEFNKLLSFNNFMVSEIIKE